MKLITLLIASLLACGQSQESLEIDNQERFIKISSHEKYNIEELFEMIDVAQKKNLRGSVDVQDLINCDQDVTPQAKYKAFRQAPKETVRIEYTYITDTEDKN